MIVDNIVQYRYLVLYSTGTGMSEILLNNFFFKKTFFTTARKSFKTEYYFKRHFFAVYTT